jgi:hypothetical protein
MARFGFFGRPWLGVLVIAALVIGMAAAGLVWFAGESESAPRVNIDAERVAIKGYDPVAYFSAAAAQRGQPDITAEWQGAIWRFTSIANRDLFQSDPEHYSPQFGGYCASGMVLGEVVDVDPEAWVIVEGRLYLNQSEQALADLRQGLDADNLTRAEQHWQEMTAKQ